MNRILIFFLFPLAVALFGAAGQVYAASAAAPRIESSTINVNAVASGIRAEGIAGSSSSSRSFLGRRRSSSTPEIPAVVEVGVVDVSGGVVLSGSTIHVNAVASGIDVRGATVRVGGVYLGP